MRCDGSGRAAARMRERLADAFWRVLEDERLDGVSVGAMCDAAGVSRGSFYYHFADRDELLSWALRREILDADRAGTPLVQLMAGDAAGDAAAARAAERTIGRLCLLIDHGGMDVVYNAMAEAALAYWRAALCPEGGELSSGASAIVEYDVGGMVGMLCRSGSSTDEERRAALLFLRERHGVVARRICREEGIAADELRARLAGIGSRATCASAQVPA